MLYHKHFQHQEIRLEIGSAAGTGVLVTVTSVGIKLLHSEVGQTASSDGNVDEAWLAEKGQDWC